MSDILQMSLALRSPLCAARRPTAVGQPVRTAPFLPGTLLRGGIANAWLAGRTFGELDDDEQRSFRTLFLSGALRFLDAWPQERALHVAPATSWTFKERGGWYGDDGDGVLDVLATLLRGEDPEEVDGGVTEPHRGDPPLVVEGRRYRWVTVARELISRTAVNAQRGVARDEQLYTFEALSPGQLFATTIVVDREALPADERAAFEALWQDCRVRVLAAGGQLHAGQGRSRGMGWLTVEASQVTEAPPTDAIALADAIRRFTSLVRGDDDSVMLIPVTLRSDVVLRDRFLRSTTDATPHTLGRYSPSPPDSMRRVPAGVVQSSAWSGGWDAIRGVPRQPLLATAAGSVWTFAVDASELDAAARWWAGAVDRGLGERTTEGFGRVQVCHPFQLDRELR